MSGHYAGPVSRVLTTALDFAASFTVYGFLASAVTYLLDTFTPADVAVSAPGIVAAVPGGAWLVLWPRLPLQLAHHRQGQVRVQAALVQLVEHHRAEALEEGWVGGGVGQCNDLLGLELRE